MSDKKTVLFFFSDYSILGEVHLDLKEESHVIEPINLRRLGDFKDFIESGKKIDMLVAEIFPEGLVLEGGVAGNMIREMKKYAPTTEIVLWYLEEGYKQLIDSETRKGCFELEVECGSERISQEIHRLLGFDMKQSNNLATRATDRARC